MRLFEVGTEVFILDPEPGYGIIKNIDPVHGCDIILENGELHNIAWNNPMAFAHFDTVEAALQEDHRRHVGFVIGPNTPIYIPRGDHPISTITIGLGNSIELPEPHINIYQTQLDEINHTGITLSLIRNEYIPHLRMIKELSKDEFKFVKKILKRDWNNIQEMWNQGDPIWSPNPIQFDSTMPEYDFNTITILRRK